MTSVSVRHPFLVGDDAITSPDNAVVKLVTVSHRNLSAIINPTTTAAVKSLLTVRVLLQQKSANECCA